MELPFPRAVRGHMWMVRYDWMEEETDFFYVDISNQEEKI